MLGWLRNGSLLRRAEEHGFEVFLTADQGRYGEQNHLNLRIAIVLLTGQRMVEMFPRLAEILAAIEKAERGSFCVVECATIRP